VRAAILAASLLPFAAQAGDCLKSAEAAARQFVALGVTDPVRSAGLVEPVSLEAYGERIRQVLDVRYAPGSVAIRQRLLGPDWSDERLRSAATGELVAAYLAAGLAQRASYRVKILGATSSRQQWGMGKDVTVSYRLAGPNGEQDLKKVLSVAQDSSCWKVEMPFDVYDRIGVLANALKEGRPEPVHAVNSRSAIKLQLLHASYLPKEGMHETTWSRSRSGETRIWVGREPIVTEAGLLGTSAYWSCDNVSFEYPSLHLLLNPGAAQALNDWSSTHLGEDMALLVDGKVVSYGKVAGKLDRRLQLCMADRSLEEVEALAADIAGK
jgi:hypothetical protein